MKWRHLETSRSSPVGRFPSGQGSRPAGSASCPRTTGQSNVWTEGRRDPTAKDGVRVVVHEFGLRAPQIQRVQDAILTGSGGEVAGPAQ